MPHERELTLDEILAGAKETLGRTARISNRAKLEAAKNDPVTKRLAENPDYTYGDVGREILTEAGPLAATLVPGPVGLAAGGYYALDAIKNLVQNPSLGTGIMAGLSALPFMKGSKAATEAVKKVAAPGKVLQGAEMFEDVGTRAAGWGRSSPGQTGRIPRRVTPDPNRATQPYTMPSEGPGAHVLTGANKFDDVMARSANPVPSPGEVARPFPSSLNRQARTVEGYPNINPQATVPGARIRMPEAVGDAAERQLTRGVQVGTPSQFTGGVERTPGLQAIQDAAERQLTRGVQVGRADEFTDFVPPRSAQEDLLDSMRGVWGRRLTHPGIERSEGLPEEYAFSDWPRRFTNVGDEIVEQTAPTMSEADEVIRALRANVDRVPAQGSVRPRFWAHLEEPGNVVRRSPLDELAQGEETAKREVLFGGVRPSEMPRFPRRPVTTQQPAEARFIVGPKGTAIDTTLESITRAGGKTAPKRPRGNR